MKKYTVFMLLPDADAGDPVYHSQVRARSYAGAYREAIRLYVGDATEAGVYTRDCGPRDADFQCVAVVAGWPRFKLEP